MSQKPENNQPADDDTNGDDPVVFPVPSAIPEHKQGTKQTDRHEYVAQKTGQEREKPGLKKFRIRVKRAWRKTSWDRKVELLFAGVIVLFSFLQYRSSIGSARQAQAIVESAQHIESAAWKFSGAAEGINNAGWSAVGQLQNQVNQMDATRKSSFSETEKAIQIDQRPWLKVEIAPDSQNTEFHDGDVPYAVFRVTNTGKTPAKIVTLGVYVNESPRIYDLRSPIGTCSSWSNPVNMLINPGSPSDFKQTNPYGTPLAKGFDSNMLYKKSRLLSVGCITYKDIIDNQSHWFTWCLSWRPKTHWGFCPIGNDAGDGEKIPNISWKTKYNNNE